MLFRLTYTVGGYFLNDQDGIRIEVGGPHAFVVVLRDEPGEGSAQGAVILEVTGDFAPPRKSAQALEDLARGLLPVDSRLGPGLASEITERRLPAGRGLGFSELPNRLCDLNREVARELANTAAQVFGLIRWRCAMYGPAEAIYGPAETPWSRQLPGVEWSDDSGNWRVFPPEMQWHEEILPQDPFSPEEITDLEAMATSGAREPVAHALLREAQRAEAQREYASALVMAIAALEIAVKQLIGTLVPAAEWLTLHAPSPPVFEILKDYLPTVPAHESIGGNVAALPAEILEGLRNGIYRRNEIVHKGQGELRQVFISRVLGAVSNVVWVCDYFTGHKWALQNLSDMMLDALPASEAVGSEWHRRSLLWDRDMGIEN
jgi:hypothetical protein